MVEVRKSIQSKSLNANGSRKVITIQSFSTRRCVGRFLISNCWEDLYPHFYQEALPKITSDHWSILLSCSKKDLGAAPFRFENMWTLHPTFLDCAGRWWA